MEIKNSFVIGDVHGCYHTLLNLIKKLPKDANLIFVGDLCDKGNYSKDVIQFVIQNNYSCVKGNHEHLFEKYILNAVEKGIHSPWSSDKRYGGQACIDSYKGDIQSIKNHLHWIKNLPMYLNIGKYFITHGFALNLYKHRDNQKYYNDFLLNRYYQDNIEPQVDEEIVNIFGHCVFDEVQKGKKFFALDTGCSSGGKLSAISLGSLEIIQEDMDSADSSYIVRELTLEYFNKDCTLEDITQITLNQSCYYKEFDTIAHEVLLYILKKFPKEGLDQIKAMHKRAVIFPKQLNRILETF